MNNYDNQETKYYDPSMNDPVKERRVSPLTRFKFDLLIERAKIEVKMASKGLLEWEYDLLWSRSNKIDNAVMLLNEALEQGKK